MIVRSGVKVADEMASEARLTTRDSLTASLSLEAKAECVLTFGQKLARRLVDGRLVACPLVMSPSCGRVGRREENRKVGLNSLVGQVLRGMLDSLLDPSHDRGKLAA